MHSLRRVTTALSWVLEQQTDKVGPVLSAAGRYIPDPDCVDQSLARLGEQDDHVCTLTHDLGPFRQRRVELSVAH